jgi:vacuolar-type H+-ATPase subunit F/Vma7
MKFFATFFALFLTAGITTSAVAQEDAISKYFSKYVDDERFTVVYVSGKMFEMINKMEIDLDDEEAEAILSVVKDLKGLRILTTEENGLQFYNEALKIINKNEYETLMTVREGKSEHVQFLVKDSNGGNNINELLLLVGGENEDFVLISFIGNIDLKEVSKLSKAFKDEDGKSYKDKDKDKDKSKMKKN